MAPKHLSVVPGADAKPEQSEIYDFGRGPDTVADRVMRVQSLKALMERLGR